MMQMNRTARINKNFKPKLARALYTNTPEAKNELFFRKGDILVVQEFDHGGQSGWWLCTLLGERGICPGNYLELLECDYENQDADNIPSYDVPPTYNHPVEVISLDYDVPKSPLPIYNSGSLVRSRKHGSDTFSLGSTGSINRVSSISSASSTTPSSSSCSETSFPIKSSCILKHQSNIDSAIYSNHEALLELEQLVQSTTLNQPDYDIPRPSTIVRQHSIFDTQNQSMSGRPIASGDSKETLDVYDTPRVVKNCVNIFEDNKYDHVQYRPPQYMSSSIQRRDASKRSSISSTASSSTTSSNPQAAIETHFGVILRNAGSLKNTGSISSKDDNTSDTYDVPPSRNESKSASLCDSTEPLSYHAQTRQPLPSRASYSINFEHEASPLSAEVKILPLCPQAAVSICEKLRQEVITSIYSILTFVKPKWRLKPNLTEVIADIRFGCVRLNLAVKDFTDFCFRTVSNSKKFKLDSVVIRLQKLLTPLTNASQLIQKDVDELDAYLWSVDRLSVAAGDSDASGDALDQLVSCARSLQYDVTEIANFIALNSTPIFQEVGDTAKLNTTVPLKVTVEEDQEDYDYVTLSSVPAENNESVTRSSLLNSKDHHILEFYSTQIATITPLLSQSISTFISSVHQNDPPKIFNGHLKYVILLAYKMLFAGDTIHRNFCNEEVKTKVEAMADELHKAVIALHDTSKVATRDFPKIVAMQKIIDHIWETTSAAARLKQVIFNAAL